MNVLGLLSGTSLDGVDAALTEMHSHDNCLHWSLRAFATVPYSAQLQDTLFGLLDPHSPPTSPQTTVRDVCALNFAVGEEFAAAAHSVIAAAGLKPQLIASHGQTLYHLMQPDERAPFARSTLQIGEPAVIAERTGLTCVADFRVADVAAGGQGAPLVSYADYEFFRAPSESRAILNIGGIANVTLLPENAELAEVRAFDTGPGNMLIDRAARTLFDGNLRFDRNGDIARKGNANGALLDWLLAHAYFARPAPKTTGHEEFGAGFFFKAWHKAQTLSCEPADFVATLTQLTATTIARALPHTIGRIIVSGGGAHNKTLLAMFGEDVRQRFSRPPIIALADEFGCPVDAKEAMAFALLGFQAVHGRHNNVPGCTGARHAAILGKVVPGLNFVEVMQSAL